MQVDEQMINAYEFELYFYYGDVECYSYKDQASVYIVLISY